MKETTLSIDKNYKNNREQDVFSMSNLSSYNMLQIVVTYVDAITR